MSNSLPRLATTNDLQAVIKLLTQVWDKENPDRWRVDLQEQEECGDGARRGVWVLEVGGTVLAVATVQRGRQETIAGRTWPVYLAYLIIDKDHRGHGFGARLEEHVMRELARQGCSGAYLQVDKGDPGWEKALGFWEHQGWEQAADSPPKHILMTKRTAASPA